MSGCMASDGLRATQVRPGHCNPARSDIAGYPKKILRPLAHPGDEASRSP